MTDPNEPPSPSGVPSGADAASPPPPGPSFEQRMQSFGHEVEDVASRWSRDPSVKGSFTFVGRVWGLVLLVAGAWLFAGVTLGYDLPSVPLRELWPLALIALGGAVILRGFARRT